MIGTLPMISILPPLCIRNVRSETLVDRDALERADRVDDALAVRGVDAGDGHVARDAALVDAHEVDRAEDRALVRRSRRPPRRTRPAAGAARCAW